MEKIWNIKNKRTDGISIIESILETRGVNDPQEIHEFLSEKPKKTYDPFLLKNMSEVVERITEYLEHGSKIIIYGDYDVDGITATSLLFEFFREITQQIDYYIPNRFSEGYGLNKDALRYIKEEMSGELVITVDNGISSFQEVEYAKEIGLDIIITDHHCPPENLPQCLIINAKQKGDNYPFKELCGCGVAFKLAQALQRELNLPKTIINKKIDLTALATISDLVPLIDENRTLVKYGLNSINGNKRIGIAALREKAGLQEQKISAGNVGFTLGPCFNASGRVEDARLGVQLLLEKNIDKAIILADKLYQLNILRQNMQSQGEEICIQMVQKEYMDHDFLVLKVKDISEGVIGIIASKVKDYFYKPTLILTEGEEGMLKGSGRSIKGIDIFHEMNQVSDLFMGFGGHEMACGFSMEEINLPELRERLNERAKAIKKKNPEIFIPKVDIVTEIQAHELNIGLINEITKLEPYGVGNPKPLFIIKNIQVNNNWTKPCGKDNTHLKFSGKKGNYFLNGIGFDLAHKYRGQKLSSNVDVAFSAEINDYKGRINPQMIIEDIKEA